MPQIPAEKSYFTFSGGLNTDASPIQFPDESTQDEANYEMLLNGSRRRRKALDLEVGGSNYTLTGTLGTSDAVKTYNWRNAGGTGTDWIVTQNGHYLTFFTDQQLPSASVSTQVIDLRGYKVSGKADTDVSQNPVSMTSGRHRLIVVGRYLEPMYIEWSGSAFTVTTFVINERDFVGIDDGVSAITEPTATPNTNAHEYNLRNRGWKAANITQYYTDKSKYPSKNMYPWKGYRRTIVSTIPDEDGTWNFSSDKMEKELFGNTFAVSGHFIINPFDTTYTGSGATVYTIDGITTDWSSSGNTVTINIPTHGLTGPQNVLITGNDYSYTGASFPIVWTSTLDGTHSATYVDADNYTISVSEPYEYGSSENFFNPGEIVLTSDSELMTNGTPYTTDERPQQVQWYAGRVFFFGIDDPKLGDRVYFSRIVEDEKDYGKCYQAADPTDVEFNALVATDGGVIVVPDIGKAKGSAIYGSSLLIFTTNGVWQFSGGQSVFTAESYQVRKLSDYSCTSPYGVTKGGDSVYWTGDDGIFRVFQDPQTGFLTSENLSINRVQVLWNGLGEAEQQKVKLAYDRSQQRVYMLYQTTTGYNANQYDAALVFDIRLNAFYRLVFPSAAANYVVHLFPITSSEGGENNKNMKFIAQTSTRTIFTICDMDQTDFTDFDGAEQLPYMVTGYDNLSDFQRAKQAPILHVFSSKTETGYTASGTDLIPVNESSSLLRSVWDWSDNSNSGKFGTQQQVYRHRRYYQPTGAGDGFDDGYPVVVTRNKLRGRGKVLHLRFDGETGKDSHILGWALQYKASRGA